MSQRKLKNENKIFKTQFLKKIVEVIHRNFLNLCVIKKYYFIFKNLFLKKNNYKERINAIIYFRKTRE